MNPLRTPGTIGRRETDRLLDGYRPVNPAHIRLADLLAAAAGPAQPSELAGQHFAVRRFGEAHRPHRSTPSRRRIGTAVTAAAAAALLGGTAYAAGSGQLPDSLQRPAHDLLSVVGVPAPHRPPTPPASAAPLASPPFGTHPNGPPAGPSPLTASPARGRLIELCRVWQAFEVDSSGRPVTADERHLLGDAAGGNGAKEIDAFCENLIGPLPTRSADNGTPGNPGSPGPSGHKPSHPVKSPNTPQDLG
jgi:hypothetical protein